MALPKTELSSEPLLNEFQVAEMLGFSVATLRRRRWAGKPPAFVKIGSAVRYKPAVIATLIQQGQRTVRRQVIWNQ